VAVVSGQGVQGTGHNILSDKVAPLNAMGKNGGYCLSIPEEACSPAMLRATLKIIWLLALRSLQDAGLEAMPLHGNLLCFPDSGRGIVCFGPSGMGKTTAGQRWTRQGGDCQADDMLLVVRENDRYLARAMPTWSRFPDAVEVSRSFMLDGVFLLQRGEGDVIVKAREPAVWRHELVQEMMFHFGGGDFFCAEEQAKMLDKSLKLTEGLSRNFGAYEILGALDGTLLENVKGFLRRRG